MPLTQEILTAAVKALREFEFVAPMTADTWLRTEFDKTTAGTRGSLKTALEALKHKDDPDAAKKTAAVDSVMALFTELDKMIIPGKNAMDALTELSGTTPALIGVKKMENINAIDLITAIQKERFSTLVLKVPAPGGLSHEDIRKAENAAKHLGVVDKDLFRECFDFDYAVAVMKIDAAIKLKFPTPTVTDQAAIDKAKLIFLKFIEAVFDAREEIEGTKSNAAPVTKSSAKEQPTFLKNIDAEVAKDPKYKESERKKHENTLQVLDNIHKGLEWETNLSIIDASMAPEKGRKKFFKEEFEEKKQECETTFKAEGWKVVAGDLKATMDIGKNFSIKTTDGKSVLVDGSIEDHVKVTRSTCEAAGIPSEDVGDKMIALAVEGAKLKGLTEVAINSCPKDLQEKLIAELGKAKIKAITDEQLTKKVKASELFNPLKGKGADPAPATAKKSWYDLRPSPWK